ncbi:AMP-binding protein [Gaoshiqia sp. Z1-71]|uniref:AMP-binding protein n=1 Tax=Gaoshiqia hydrogeniformans TaxID=3290090 RepID=UPI003BF7CD6D
MGGSEKLTMPAMLQASFERYGDRNSLVFAGEETRTYRELQSEVEKLGTQLRVMGIRRGAKIAILSTNMPNWGVAFFAIASVGAVAVPVLPDFHTNEIRNILQHAEVEAVFVSENLISKLEPDEYPLLKIIRIENFREVNSEDYPVFNRAEEPLDFEYEDVDEEDLVSIIYTSGTTGKSKGVMLTHKNVVWTARQSYYFQDISPSDRFLSVLPLSHTFENTLGLIFPVMHGASVYYLRKPPTAPVLLPALQVVKPTIMLVVPLIIEKVYKGKILPQINSNPITRSLYQIRPFKRILSRIAGKKLYQTFGGELRFFGIGGAKLDDQVERFLMDAGFPLAIGYGLTETSPLLAGAVGKNVRYLSTGIPLRGVELRVANANPATGEGEVQARGENVMKGYYKEPQLTADVFTEDCWFRTGDLGKFDRSGFLYIKGRIKNMIVGASGENIYPEEIESLINRMEFVLESLVIQQKGRLVAMVHLNMEEIEARFKQMKEEAVQKFNHRVDEILNEIQQKVNEEVNKFSRIQTIILQPVPFEKTPTQKIKRFLYYS